jgi:hypothetical protein
MGSARKKGRRPQAGSPTLAKSFVVEGLDASTLSPDRVFKAMDAGELLTWSQRARAASMDPSMIPRAPRLRWGQGLRLIAPIGTTRATDAIRRIVAHPGYEGLLKNVGPNTGFASFVVDASSQKWRRKPALSWPLYVTGSADVLKLLGRSNAVKRGLARLVPLGHKGSIPADAPYVLADIVNFQEADYSGETLGLRFLQGGATRTPLPDRMRFGRLKEIEPTVFLRSGRSTPADRFTRFVYELAHNLPVDVAAWLSTRNFRRGPNETPLVVASADFLRGARVSDTLPGLQTELVSLGDTVVPVSREDLNRLGVRYFKRPQRFRAYEIADLLGSPELLEWKREKDTGEGLVAIRDGVAEAQAGDGGGRFHRPDSGGSARPDPEAMGGRPSPQEAAAAPPIEPPPKTAQPPLPPPRYTDVKILDAKEKQLEAEPHLIRGQRYVLDVAIRVKREGLGRDRKDQKGVAVTGQTETVPIWIVVSDETEGDEQIPGNALKLEKRIADLQLPVTGDSNGSAQFPFTALVEKHSRETQVRLGVRLYHKLNLIDHVQLDLRFAALSAQTPASATRKRRKAQPGIELVFKHVDQKRGVESPDPAAAARALTISISRRDSGSELYTIAFVAGKGDADGKPVLYAVKKLSETQLNAWVVAFRNTLLDTVFGPSFNQVKLRDQDCTDLINNLARLGTQIATRLFDYGDNRSDLYKLGRMIRETLPETALVQISLSADAQDFVFPWQTLSLVDYDAGATEPADPRNLWGYRFVIEVKRCGDGVDVRLPSARQATRARITYGRWNFRNEPEHYAKLEALVQARKDAVELLAPVVEAPKDMLAALSRGGGELFYIYAHGYSAAPNGPSTVGFRTAAQDQVAAIEQRIKTNVGQYSTEQLEAWRDINEQFLKAIKVGADSELILKNGGVALTFLLNRMQGAACPLTDAPIVFLNTCDSAQIWNAIEDSFVSLFLSKGARAVLGTESTIPVVLADEFGRSVLESMIGGSTLGRAVLDGRNRLLNEYQNPLGLCYCIYGDASARLLNSSPADTRNG